MIVIREETAADVEAIRSVVDAAFGQPQEGELVHVLRDTCGELLSLVATDNGRIVGHILFSPATLEAADGSTIHGMGLAPMAVHPERQREGIGSMLVHAGLTRLREADCPFVIVLGHPEYYPRFGFEPASARRIHCEWEVPDDVFMILVFDEARLAGVSGLARYRPEFHDVT